MASVPTPHYAQSSNGLIHLSYDFSYRIHTANVYPVRAPNGSSLIIYGHDHGLTILWRGGKEVKSQPLTKFSQNANIHSNEDSSSDAIMLINSNNEEQASADQEAYVPHYEDNEFDPSRPYDEIIHRVDLQLETDVLHLAIPPLHLHANSNLPASVPIIFGEKLFVAIACSNCSAFLISLPLSLTHASTNTAEILDLQSQFALSSPARGIALSWMSNFSSKSALKSNNRTSDLMVAIHAAVGPSTLFLFKVEVDATSFLHSAGKHGPVPEIQRLSSLASSISFNPCDSESSCHNQLLIAESRGSVRIFDYSPSQLRQMPISADVALGPDQRPIHQGRGRWIASFFPPFEMSNATDGFPQRKQVLDAQWICNGKCIILLLGDGEWGLWDVENLGPKLHGVSTTSNFTMRGAAITPFALRGFVGDDTASGRTKARPIKPTDVKHVEKLAPMTPNTRRSKQIDLFSSIDKEPPRSTFTTGAIDVTWISALGNKQAEESILMYFAGKVLKIPEFTKFWRRAALIPENARMSVVEAHSLFTVPGIATGGEKITAIAQFTPRLDTRAYSHDSSQTCELDILVSAEHRLIIICPEQRFSQIRKNDDTVRRQANNALAKPQVSFQVEQDLLTRGDLDIGGVERLLDHMPDSSSKQPFRVGSGAQQGRRLGFATEY